jgi:hypothetical protein
MRRLRLEDICAQGKVAMKHPGNIRFHALVSKSVAAYGNTSSRLEKTNVFYTIVKAVRSMSPRGGFIKYKDGYWNEVGDSIAREKISQGLREWLHIKYNSNTMAKCRQLSRALHDRANGPTCNTFSTPTLVV